MPILQNSLRFCLMALCLVAFIGCEQEAPPKPQLHLTTTPPGASVFIDGKEITSTVTPLKGNIPPGEHMLEIRLEGHHPAWLALPNADSGVITRDVTLEPLTAAIHIDSVPPGASVTVDGRAMGVTPLLIPKMALGEHELEMTAAGHASRTVTVQVPNARPQRWGYDLTSLMGSVKIVSIPGGAKVFVDGHEKGKTPSIPGQALTVTDLLEGSHEVRIALPNHVEVTDAFVLERGSVKTLAPYRLEELPGGVTLITEPAGALVYQNGGQIGVTPHTIEDLRPGQYEYELRLDEYKNANASVVISPGITKQVDVKMTKTTGSLMFSTEPPGCVVILDRQRLGTTARGDNEQVSEVFTHDGIQPGPHLLQIDHPKYESWKRSITVTEGENINLKVITLDKRFIPTHRLKIKSPVNGKTSTYEGVLLKELEDGSIEFQTAKTTVTTFTQEEIDDIKRIR